MLSWETHFSPLVLPTSDDTKRRAADIAYDKIEMMICKLVLAPGSPVVENDLVKMTALGRTPVREALMRMVSMGLIVQQPRRGLAVSNIDLLAYLDMMATRRVLEKLIAVHSAKRGSALQKKALITCAEQMVVAAEKGSLDAYMQVDQALDHVNYEASRNQSAVWAITPLVVQCRRFWYAYQHEGDMKECALAHLRMAEAIASCDVERAAKGSDILIDHLEEFARNIVNV